METAALSVFALILIVFLALGLPIVWALAAGYAVFFLYARMAAGMGVREILRVSWRGIYGARHILEAFVLIGMLTASWRVSGTIPAIIHYALPFIEPGWFLGAVFLINCLVSFLTGTSFGTAATVGVICMALSSASGMSAVLSGGAVLSGIFFGDRCSPVSTSALLVADLTGTDVSGNIPGMMRSALVPFLATLLAYSLLSSLLPHAAAAASPDSLFSLEFRLGIVPLIPAFLMLLLCLLHLGTKMTMALSVAAAIAVCILYERIPVLELPRMLFMGFSARTEELKPIIDGGGIMSMAEVAAIVAISSSYSGISASTGMLEGVRRRIASSSQPHRAIIAAVSVITSMIACNQTLATMLTHQLCSGLLEDRREMAITLENTVIVISPLIPWSIAGSVPLAVIGTSPAALAAAFYLYLIPIWWISCGMRRH